MDAAQNRRWFAIALLGCALIFGLLINGHWVRSGDGEVYLGIARNLAVGQGYRFNGQPVATLPPLWPVVLAGAMKISPSFAFLKLIPLFSMIGFLACSYWIMLRFTTPARSAAVVLLTAILAQVFPLSIYFLSDALFSLMACAALLLAMQINEGRATLLRAIAMILLAAASVAVRWNGVLWWPMIAAALLRGQFPRRKSTLSPCTQGEGGGEGSFSPADVPSSTLSPALSLEYKGEGENHGSRNGFAIVCALVSGVACALVFILLRHDLRVSPADVDPRYDPFLSIPYNLLNTPQNFAELCSRIVTLGEWVSGLLWQLLDDSRVVRPYAIALGWIVLLGAGAWTWRELCRGNTLGVAGALQLLVLAFDWPHAMPRYILPMAPLLILAAWLGFESLIDSLPRSTPWRKIFAWGVTLFLASLVLVNLPQYALELWVQRSSDFASRNEGGVYQQFVAAAKWLQSAPPNVEIAVSHQTSNHGHALITDGPMRAMSFLTHRPIMLAPDDLSTEPTAALATWAAAHNVKYYLWQPPIVLTYHIRGTPWAPRKMNETDYDWRVYELKDGNFNRVKIPDANNWPENVPGMTIE